MALKFDTATRNAIADAIESAIGTTPTIELRTGAPPAATTDADSGTLLRTITLPSDWLTAGTAGAVSKVGTWQDTNTSPSGTVGHFRLKDSGTTVRMQGTVTATGGGGDMTIADTNITTGVAIDSFTLTSGNA